MGRKTLDLFRLYRMVKERGFWQEVSKRLSGILDTRVFDLNLYKIPALFIPFQVTDNKLWPEISNLMGLGSTSTSGFTLKKQYCKYLYGYECKMERGEAEPQEALARYVSNIQVLKCGTLVWRKCVLCSNHEYPKTFLL